MRISIMEANFSQILGTLAKIVGETSRRFCGSVSMLSTKLTVPADPDGLKEGDQVLVNVGQGKVGDHLIGFITWIGRQRIRSDPGYSDG